MHIQKKFVLFVAICIPLLFWHYSQMRSTSLQYLDQEGTVYTLSLPLRDRDRLFALMKELFTEDSFAYTLLGHKPLSWSGYSNPWPFIEWESFCSSFSNYNRRLRLGWKTWEKYSHLFPTANLWAETSSRHPGSVSILIVNEEEFNAIVKNNQSDFQDVLHREVFNGDLLLREAKKSSLIDEVLQGHQAMLGIVLGYGRENSWEFHRRAEKREFFYWVWDENHEEKPGEIVTRLGGITPEECLELDSIPSFAGYPHSEESIALKKDYLETKQRVINYYKGKDFLEATLSLLAGYRPEE